MMLPPKAGRVWRRSMVDGSIESSVQSAVRPVRIFAATRGSRERPTTVPPPRKISGFFSMRIWATSSACTSSSKSPMDGVVDHPDLVHAVGEELVGVLPHAVAHQDGAHRRGELLLQLPGGADDLGDHGGELSPAVLGEHADARVLRDVLALEGAAGDDDRLVALARLDAGAAERALHQVDDGGGLALPGAHGARERDGVVGARLDAEAAAHAVLHDDADGVHAVFLTPCGW